MQHKTLFLLTLTTLASLPYCFADLSGINGPNAALVRRAPDPALAPDAAAEVVADEREVARMDKGALLRRLASEVGEIVRRGCVTILPMILGAEISECVDDVSRERKIASIVRRLRVREGSGGQCSAKRLNVLIDLLTAATEELVMTQERGPHTYFARLTEALYNALVSYDRAELIPFDDGDGDEDYTIREMTSAFYVCLDLADRLKVQGEYFDGYCRYTLLEAVGAEEGQEEWDRDEREIIADMMVEKWRREARRRPGRR